MKDWFSNLTVPKMTGLSLAVLVGGYTSWVTATGGLTNPERPQSSKSVQGAIEKHITGKQTFEQLKALAWGKSTEDTVVQRYKDEAFFSEMDERITEHRELARKERTLPEGYSNDLRAFFQEEVPKMDTDTMISVPAVEAKTALFSSEYQEFELLCASKEQANIIFEGYLRSLVATRWLSRDLMFDEANKRGYLVATRGDNFFLITVREDGTFPNFISTVYWRVEMYPEE